MEPKNLSKAVKRRIREQNISQHITTSYHYELKGRIEKYNQTLLKTLNRTQEKGIPYSKIRKAAEAYNQTFHSSIGMTKTMYKIQNYGRR